MSKQVDRSLDDGSVVMSEAGIRNSERLEGAKMKIVQLPRNVPPRITDNDVLRRTDDGRDYPNNKINTKQYPNGFKQFVPVLFAM